MAANWLHFPFSVWAHATGPDGKAAVLCSTAVSWSLDYLVDNLLDRSLATQFIEASRYSTDLGRDQMAESAGLWGLLAPTEVQTLIRKVAGDGREEIDLELAVRTIPELAGIPFEAIDARTSEQVPTQLGGLTITSVTTVRRPRTSPWSTGLQPLGERRVLVIRADEPNQAHNDYREAAAERLEAELSSSCWVVSMVDPTAADLAEALCEWAPEVIVLIAHGHPPTRTEPSGKLVLGDELSGTSLRDLILASQHSPPAIVTSACWSATGSPDGPGFASTLAEVSPLVVAMNGEFPASLIADFLPPIVSDVVDEILPIDAVRAFREAQRENKPEVGAMPVVYATDATQTRRLNAVGHEASALSVHQLIGLPPVDVSAPRAVRVHLPSPWRVTTWLASSPEAPTDGKTVDVPNAPHLEALRTVLSDADVDVQSVVVTTNRPSWAPLPESAIKNAELVAILRLLGAASGLDSTAAENLARRAMSEIHGQAPVGNHSAVVGRDNVLRWAPIARPLRVAFPVKSTPSECSRCSPTLHPFGEDHTLANGIDVPNSMVVEHQGQKALLLFSYDKPTRLAMGQLRPAVQISSDEV